MSLFGLRLAQGKVERISADAIEDKGERGEKETFYRVDRPNRQKTISAHRRRPLHDHSRHGGNC